MRSNLIALLAIIFSSKGAEINAASVVEGARMLRELSLNTYLKKNSEP